jgi:hypothetical protein
MSLFIACTPGCMMMIMMIMPARLVFALPTFQKLQLLVMMALASAVSSPVLVRFRLLSVMVPTPMLLPPATLRVPRFSRIIGMFVHKSPFLFAQKIYLLLV